ncbi:hypothetical protein GL286_06430 [Paracoccus aestuariivivens]|uniref:Flagellar motor switch protein FliN-like C-terminal domain-containing protein n=1 Tax=Paracoccus aestuariivivens TaxID=1820333 RepID=A0A6L6J857_9RHOB|nr:hypothetical protein [Paracoccus aestuariivivens]
MLLGMIAARAAMRAPEQNEIQRLSEKDSERAAAIALGRAAERTHGLPLFSGTIRFSTMSVPEMPEFLPERPLLAIVEDRSGRIGFVALCPNLLASMIEMQALGRVTSRPAQIRRPTRTDAVISAEFVNALLEELGRELSGQSETANYADFRYVAYLDDPRPLSLMLEDGNMIRLSYGFRIGSGGQRDGQILIGLPSDMVQPQPSPRQKLTQLSPPEPEPVAPPPTKTLAEAVHKTPIALCGVLYRRSMTLKAIRALQPGSLLPMPNDIIDQVRVETASGQLLARGRLGEKNGYRAIKLQPIDSASPEGPAFAQPAESTVPDTAQNPDPPPPLGDLNQPDPFRQSSTEDDLAQPATRSAGT